MRMICPNCGAQYEVDDAVIPDQGRDVQCSNCGHTWFQQPAHRDADLADELELGVSPAGDAGDDDTDDDSDDSSLKRRGLDPAVADVLREEAAHEAEVRRAEADGLESQPDLGLDDAAAEVAANRSAAARARMARLRGLEDAGGDADTAAALAATGPRRDLLPDVEEINSTLRATEDREEANETPAEANEATDAPRKGGSRLLSRLIILGFIAAVLVYIFAPRIIAALPQSEPYLVAYVDWANSLRAQINSLIGAGIEMVKGLFGQGAEG